jgi:hypothetical protein
MVARRLTLLLAVAVAGAGAVAGAVAVLGPATALAGTGAPAYSKEQAGYSVTGRNFREVEVNVQLPSAGRFAASLGRLTLSVQLWSENLVIDAGVTACTDSSCQPGGAPRSRLYRPVVTVFSRATRAVLCSTMNSSCPGVPASFNRERFRPGHRASMSIFFDNDADYLVSTVGSQAYSGYVPPSGIRFTQARIGAELGATPWTTITYRTPSREQLLATFGVPVGPPYEAEFALQDRAAGCVASPRYAHHQVLMTRSGSSATWVRARPGGLSNLGCNFGVYLRR